ncbi:hypothetical protein RFI_39863 [Reticulomyxa filosa]|uniref:Protein kinase domain-containing protein n=1 Tax=Reticulomyxa filosa TaxID=46433 RepID=X6L7C3_RETFI|nr:hypothetical protein RFI_39863 [Reticulomyxa filosa]|eukprot:ETN97667.1 hypothetical protein RFI_39863 [Reticulomyxa filosa]
MEQNLTEIEENEQIDQTEQTDQNELNEQQEEVEQEGTDLQGEKEASGDAAEKEKAAASTKSKPRSIGRWYIGETLGKGGYSWVKKGYDKKTSKCVALKFMAKADNSWAEEQVYASFYPFFFLGLDLIVSPLFFFSRFLLTKQVVTEIESLKQIRHQNVMKLYAYNLNAKYPTKNHEKLDCILLVLEYAPGGELFDILYYTSALESIVARTYFRQFIAGENDVSLFFCFFFANFIRLMSSTPLFH